MNTERPSMLISTGSNNGSRANVSTTSGSSFNTASRKNQISELPSPPLSPQQDHGFGSLLLQQQLNQHYLLSLSPSPSSSSSSSSRQQHDNDDPEETSTTTMNTPQETNTLRLSTPPNVSKDGLERPGMMKAASETVIQAQSRSTILESEIISNLTRTNQRLNDELDLMRSYLERLTTTGSGSGGSPRLQNRENDCDDDDDKSKDEKDKEEEGWRKEYEFLVHQVDLMHRQLQQAYQSQMVQDGSNSISRANSISSSCRSSRSSSSSRGNGQMVSTMTDDDTLSSSYGSLGGKSAETEIDQPMSPRLVDATTTTQLRTEVKELTASLKSWQAAFKRTEESYRRKCEGERTLKQTIREREAQLMDLVERLAKYEGQETDYQRKVRVRLSWSSSTPVSSPLSVSTSTDDPIHMPGLFPGSPTAPFGIDDYHQLSSSVLTWATLLAALMLA